MPAFWNAVPGKWFFTMRMGLLMLARRKFFIAVILTFAAMWGAPPAAKADSVEQQAKTFINGLADDAINALTAPGKTEQQRSQHFRQLLNKSFAIKTIARWVLGRHWKKATKAEQVEYLQLFEEMLIVTYVHRFSSYSGETLKIIKTLATGKNDVIVYSSIARVNSQTPLHVDWRVRSRKNSLKIVDVIVEGVSMGQTQRSEFASVIRQNGGKVAGLLAVLRKRVGNDT